MSISPTSKTVSDERLRNTRAWAAARIGTLSGAEVIVAACDEALAARSAVETSVAPESVLAWAVRSFGPIAKNRDERAARMAEEAVEVAQVEGVPLEVMQRITARVYSRPVGELGQEIGGLVLGLYALAANAGVDIDAEFKREFTRVLSKPADWWARKHAEKVAAGTADLTPVKAADVPAGYNADGTRKPCECAECRGIRERRAQKTGEQS